MSDQSNKCILPIPKIESCPSDESSSEDSPKMCHIAPRVNFLPVPIEELERLLSNMRKEVNKIETGGVTLDDIINLKCSLTSLKSSMDFSQQAEMLKEVTEKTQHLVKGIDKDFRDIVNDASCDIRHILDNITQIDTYKKYAHDVKSKINKIISTQNPTDGNNNNTLIIIIIVIVIILLLIYFLKK